MKRIYEFRCVKDHTTEKYIDESTLVIQCPHCANDASRIISLPTISLDGTSGDFPGAAMKWEKKRESHIKWERKMGISNTEG